MDSSPILINGLSKSTQVVSFMGLLHGCLVAYKVESLTFLPPQNGEVGHLHHVGGSLRVEHTWS